MGHHADGPVVRPRIDAESAVTAAATFQGLATPSRLLLLAALEDGPLTVGALTEAVGMEQSAVSHQLRHLRDLGFVRSQRQGRHIVYQVFDHHVAQLIDQALFHAEHLHLGVAEGAPGAREALPSSG